VPNTNIITAPSIKQIIIITAKGISYLAKNKSMGTGVPFCIAKIATKIAIIRITMKPICIDYTPLLYKIIFYLHYTIFTYIIATVF
jgi:hypothetical protein